MGLQRVRHGWAAEHSTASSLPTPSCHTITLQTEVVISEGGSASEQHHHLPWETPAEIHSGRRRGCPGSGLTLWSYGSGVVFIQRISTVGLSPPSVSPSALVLLCRLSFSLPHIEDRSVLICCFLGIGDSTQRECVWVIGQERREERGKRIQLSRNSKASRCWSSVRAWASKIPEMTRKCGCGIWLRFLYWSWKIRWITRVTF